MAIPATDKITCTFDKKYINDSFGSGVRFEAALHVVAAGIQAGKIWNQEFQLAKGRIASGCEHAQHISSDGARKRGERHFDCRDQIGYAFGMNQAAKMSRELKKLGKREPEILTAGIAAYIETLDQIDSVWKWLQSVKSIIVKGRKPSVTKTPEQVELEMENTGH